MAEINDLSVTDASNVGRWPENMPFGDVNNAGRADEGLLARWYKDTDSSITASGSSNAFTITSNRTIAAYFNNLVMAFTANHSITGATTLNMNGIGAKSVKRFNGEALASGDIITGQPIIVVYKSGSDQWFMMTALAALTDNTFVDLSENAAPGTPAADTARLYAVDGSGSVSYVAYRDAAGNDVVLRPATQAEQESATNIGFVNPAFQHFHPGHPKFFAMATVSGGTPTLQTSYNTTSITDAGTGLLTVTIATDFSSANWCAAVSVEDAADRIHVAIVPAGIAAGTIQLQSRDNSSDGLSLDPTSWHVSGLGDQA